MEQRTRKNKKLEAGRNPLLVSKKTTVTVKFPQVGNRKREKSSVSF